MHWAAKNGHEALARLLLLEHKADVNARIGGGLTALHYAADRGHKAVVRLLLEHKADVDAKEGGGRTALHWATDRGHDAVRAAAGARRMLMRRINMEEQRYAGGFIYHCIA